MAGRLGPAAALPLGEEKGGWRQSPGGQPGREVGQPVPRPGWSPAAAAGAMEQGSCLRCGGHRL